MLQQEKSPPSRGQQGALLLWLSWCVGTVEELVAALLQRRGRPPHSSAIRLAASPRSRRVPSRPSWWVGRFCQGCALTKLTVGELRTCRRERCPAAGAVARAASKDPP